MLALISRPQPQAGHHARGGARGTEAEVEMQASKAVRCDQRTVDHKYVVVRLERLDWRLGGQIRAQSNAASHGHLDAPCRKGAQHRGCRTPSQTKESLITLKVKRSLSLYLYLECVETRISR